MWLFRLVIAFLMVANWVYAEIPDRRTVVIRLQDEAAIDWTPYAGNENEKDALLGLLVDIVKSPTNLTSAIQNRALMEMGKFAVDENGQLKKDARDIYDEQINSPIRNSNDTTLRMSLIQSLLTAYVPESVDYLVKAAEQDDYDELNQDSTSIFAVDTLRNVISTDEGGRPPMPDEPAFSYYPKLGQLYSERLRSAEWEEAVKNAIAALGRLKDQPRVKKVAHRRIDVTIESAKVGLKGAPQEPPTMQGSSNEDARSTAAENTSQPKSFRANVREKIRGIEQNPFMLPLLGGMVILILALLHWRKRRRAEEEGRKLDDARKNRPKS